MTTRIFIAIGIAIFLSACGNNKKQVLNESAIAARADSIVGVKMEELNKQYMEDLDERMTIEVKAKADSIVAARTGKIDTVKKPPQHTMPKQVMRPAIFQKK